MSKPLALIVEDYEDLANLFSQVFQNDFEVEIYHDGLTALDRLQTITPAVVILDLHLPLISGLEILTHIRADNRLEKTRVIVVSADDTIAKRIEKKADLVILKPLDFQQLKDLAASLDIGS